MLKIKNLKANREDKEILKGIDLEVNKGEIVAKKLGKVYRIPATSLSFMFTGLDFDLYNADSEDRQYLDKIQQEIAKIRSEA